ncbi:MAG: DUF1285 domain-containing protein [Myxococcota bacterium]
MNFTPGPPLQSRTRETAIRRDAQGNWFNGSDPIDHPKLAASFDQWLELAEDGRFCLKNEINWAYVAIEGPAYFVRAAHVHPEGVTLTLHDGRWERLDPSTLRQDASGVLYCQVRNGTMTARFDKHATVALHSAVGEDPEGVYLRLAGEQIRPPVVSSPLVFEKALR